MKIISLILFITSLLIAQDSQSKEKLFLGNINYKPLMYEENGLQRGLIIDLTEEKQYIENNPTLNIGTYNVPPYIFSKQDKASGYIIDIANEVFSRLNIKPNYSEMLPLNKKLESLKIKELDVSLGLIENSKRKEYLDFVDVPLGLQIGIYARSDNREITNSKSYNSLL